MASGDDAKVLEVEMRIADVVGGLMEFWQFKRALGRVWAVLYLSPLPLPAAEIGERLKMSAGAVSMTLGELQKWGVVRRAWRPGERREFYEAETSLWKMITRVVRERELELVHESGAAFDAAEKALAEARGRAADAEAKRRIQFKRERVSRLLALARLGETLLRALLAGESISPSPIRDFLARRGE